MSNIPTNTELAAIVPRNLSDWGQWEPVRQLQATGQYFHQRGWSVGTSSNYSIVLSHEPLQLLLTVSGKDKGSLTPDDFLVVDAAGAALFPHQRRPSAETLLHCLLARQRGAGCILHTHSIWGTLLGERHFSAGYVEISGYEMLKGLEGVTTHQHVERIAIVPNSQDIHGMSLELAARLEQADPALSHAFLIHRHGLYTWGPDHFAARRHIEILEFLFELQMRRA